MNNQIIKCKVLSCKFQNDNKCTLKEILVNSICNEVTRNKDIICQSFECDDKKLNLLSSIFLFIPLLFRVIISLYIR